MYLRRKAKSNEIKAKFKKNFFGWLLILPSLALFVFFVWYPITYNVVLSFFNNANFENFVWFKNYADVFNEPAFQSALRNTFIYIFWSLIIGFLIPLVIGFLLSEIVHARGVFRVLVYLPCMISGIAVVFLFKSMFGPADYDVINVILIRWFGMKEGADWLGDPKYVIPVIVVAMTWRGAGGTALIYLSNFQQIDNSIYEASRLDGVSPGGRFFKLTIPMMKTTILMLLILQIISVFQVFYEPMVMTKGGTNDSISLMLLAYQYAFTKKDARGVLQIPKSAATSVILSIIILGITILYFGLMRFFERREDK